MSEFKTPSVIQLPSKKEKVVTTPSPDQKDAVPPEDSKQTDTTTPSNEKDLSEVKQRSEKRHLDKDKYNAIIASLKYREPLGASEADDRYSLEVLKNGSIVDQVRFKDKRFFIVGRIPACDIMAENPTISRMHAVLQFIDGSALKPSEEKPQEDEEVEVETQVREKGLYLYDLNSTHGTFLNKNRVFPNRFYRLRVGHVLKFGNSGRLYVVGGPPDDEEEEDEKTITELQNERLAKELERKRLAAQMEASSSVEPNVEEEGISWGMPEDAEEESDLRENPFSMDFEKTEKDFDDPKKTLRGWFENEGYELDYNVREKAVGHYICRIDLPIDGQEGKIFAEVDVKGKKKEAVLQCALQACKILDKYGVLRKSHRESKRKRKLKDWEEQDYYSSDEDTFLDRTGTVEKKRTTRMLKAGKIQQQTETYDSLLEKEKAFQKEIDELKEKINKVESKADEDNDEVDPLDAYMTDLKTGASDLKKLKTKLREVMAEQTKNKRLLEIVKPALPPVQINK